MTIEVGVGIAILGIIFGWGASWASMGASLKSLRENLEQHGELLKRLDSKLDGIGEIKERVVALEVKIFGRPRPTSSVFRAEETQEG